METLGEICDAYIPGFEDSVMRGFVQMNGLKITGVLLTLNWNWSKPTVIEISRFYDELISDDVKELSEKSKESGDLHDVTDPSLRRVFANGVLIECEDVTYLLYNDKCYD